MAADGSIQRQPSCSLSTIYSQDEVDSVDVPHRLSGEVDVVDLDVVVPAPSSPTSPKDNDKTPPPPSPTTTTKHPRPQRQWTMIGRNVFDGLPEHVSEDLQESDETSQVGLLES